MSGVWGLRAALLVNDDHARRLEQVLHAAPHDGGVLASAVGIDKNLKQHGHLVQESCCKKEVGVCTRARLNAGSDAAMTRWAYLAATVRTDLQLHN